MSEYKEGRGDYYLAEGKREEGAAMTPPREPRTAADAAVALLDLLPGTLGTDRAINRAVDDLVDAARAEAAGTPLREALIRAFLSGWHQGGQPYDATSAREGTRLANEYAALAATPAPAAPPDVEAHRAALAREPVCSTHTEQGDATDWCAVHGCEWPGEEGLCVGWLDAAFRRSGEFFTARAAATEDTDAR